MLVQDMLRDTAASGSQRAAVLGADSRVTWGELDEASDRLAAALQQSGVERGDRVGIVMPNSSELVVAMFAVMKAGGVFVVINPGSRPERAGFIMRDCGTRVVIASGEAERLMVAARALAPGIGSVVWAGAAARTEGGDRHLEEIVSNPASFRIPRQIDQDLCTIIYTSGTTGEPKGVMMTHRNIVNTTTAITQYLRNTPEDVVCCVLPLAFSYGLCQVFGAAKLGHALLIERSFAYPFDVLRRMQEHRVTGLPALPTVFARLQQMAPLTGIDLSSLRYMTNAAAPLPVAHVVRIREMFPKVALFSMYGQTECTRAMFLDPARIDDRPGSVGRAIPNCETYIVDDRGRRVGPGVAGELVVRGANVMRGYWGLPGATAEKLRDGEVAGEKVLHTGDLFRTDEEGLHYFVGRSDEVFKVRGEKVSPREIENALCELAEVAEAAAIGVDDAVDGQAVKVVLVMREGLTLSEQRVRKHCAARLEATMMPKYVEFRASLPKTDAGKLDRAALRGGGVS